MKHYYDLTKKRSVPTSPTRRPMRRGRTTRLLSCLRFVRSVVVSGGASSPDGFSLPLLMDMDSKEIKNSTPLWTFSRPSANRRKLVLHDLLRRRGRPHSLRQPPSKAGPARFCAARLRAVSAIGIPACWCMNVAVHAIVPRREILLLKEEELSLPSC